MADLAESDLRNRARILLELHTAPEILVLTNVWDVVSAQVVAATEGVRALATASHSIASTFGYPGGENIPLDLHLHMVERIVRAVELPVTMDMEAGYGDPGETARRAIAAGAVGGNLEDQLRPLDDAVAAVEAVLRAGRVARGGGVPPGGPRRRRRLRPQRPHRRAGAGRAGRRPGRAGGRGGPPRAGVPRGRGPGGVRAGGGRARRKRRAGRRAGPAPGQRGPGPAAL